MPNTLFLRLEGPLQSWGENCPWSERRTAPEPTKSGIVGLLACAMGWRDDSRLRQLSLDIRVGVRCEIQGTPTPLTDYHTVGGGYSTPQLLTAEGKPKLSSGRPHTEQTWREYLCDASFLAAVQADPGNIEKMAFAVQWPVWPVYLGRKSCPPSAPLFDGTGNYDSLAAALADHPARRWPRDPRSVCPRPRLVLECDSGQGVRRRCQVVSREFRLFDPSYSLETLASADTVIEYLGEGD
jgi:CRISPR system Cascade subunit CasD